MWARCLNSLGKTFAGYGMPCLGQSLTNQIRMNKLCTDVNHFMGELCGVVPFLGTAENHRRANLVSRFQPPIV